MREVEGQGGARKARDAALVLVKATVHSTETGTQDDGDDHDWMARYMPHYGPDECPM